MKIACNREQFLAAFQMAAQVAPARSPKPILQNVKLEVTSEGTTLMATDGEVGIRVNVAGVEVEAPGSAILPVARFGHTLRESSDEKLSISSDSQGTVIRGERSKIELPGGNPDEFPMVANFAEEKYHEISARLLKELIRRTLFATDSESSRYALGGVLLELEPEKITAVGTDGRRLAKMEGPAHSVGGHGSGDTMTIVPTRAMQLVERSLTDGDAEVQLAARSNSILVRSPRASIYAQLVEGRFPKWRDVFPQRTGATRIDMTVGPAHAALRQAAVVASEESRGITFQFGDGTLVLSAKTAEVGQSRVELPIPYEGESLLISLDHRFVADFLKVLDAEKNFTFEIESSEAAAVLSTDDGYGYVVMPLALDR